MARRKKYIFNHKTLKFEEFKLLPWQKLLRVLGYLLSVVVIAGIFLLVFFFFFGSPKERMQERELDYLKEQYALMEAKLNDMSEVLDEIEQRDDNIYRLIFEAEPVASSRRYLDFKANRYENLYGYKNSEMVINIKAKLDVLSNRIAAQSKSYDEVLALAKNKTKMLSSIPAIMPLRETDLRAITSTFGTRIDPIYKVAKTHKGIDFSSPTGTEVYATGDGKVAVVERKHTGYGNVITIDHGFGYKTKFAHLSKFAVFKGQTVKRGQLIGYVGSTGKSTGPHLHYEVLKNGQNVDPANYFYNDITPEEYEQILELSSITTQAMD